MEEDEVEVEMDEGEKEGEGEAESMKRLDGGMVEEEKRETYEDVTELDNLGGGKKEEDTEIERA